MKAARLLAVLAAVLLGFETAAAQTLYGVETNFAAPLWRSSAANGTGVATLALPAGTLPEGVAFDERRRKVYWAEAAFSGARIRRANPDGSGIETVVGGGSAFRGLALDEEAGKLYWTSSNQVEGGRIRRANLDGSGVELLLDLGAGANPRGIALDAVAGRMYWADFGQGGAVRRAHLDGTSPEVVIAMATPYGVAVDPAAGVLYWANYGGGNIWRMPIAGGPGTKVKSGLFNPTYLALDRDGGLVYWIDAGADGQKLRRSPIVPASAPIEDLPVTVTTFGGLAFSPRGIVAVPSPLPVTRFALGPVTPNPASGPAQVAFALPQASHVRLVAIDVRGREVATLVDGPLPAGRHTVEWGGRGPAGVYFLRLVAPGVDLVQRVVRIR